jgi:hypothetical protein
MRKPVLFQQVKVKYIQQEGEYEIEKNANKSRIQPENMPERRIYGHCASAMNHDGQKKHIHQQADTQREDECGTPIQIRGVILFHAAKVR